MTAGYGSRAVSESRAIGVDVGGTKILAGVVSRTGTVGHRVERQTPTTSAGDILGALDDVVGELLAPDVVAVGVGVPVNLDPKTRIAYQATNLPLAGADIRASLGASTGLPVGVENDGNAAALAEWQVGAGRGTTDLVMLTLGTGVGGGLVLDGSLYRGWFEAGHVVVDVGGPPCQGNCHGGGHLESLASGRAADLAARRLYGERADARVLVRRATEGDADAIAELVKIGRVLGAAIGSFVNLFYPDVVVVGGGFGSAAGELLLGPARQSARGEAMEPADRTLRIVAAELGPEAGVIGAGLVGFSELEHPFRR
jgi:glucokinase